MAKNIYSYNKRQQEIKKQKKKQEKIRKRLERKENKEKETAFGTEPILDSEEQTEET